MKMSQTKRTENRGKQVKGRRIEKPENQTTERNHKNAKEEKSVELISTPTNLSWADGSSVLSQRKCLVLPSTCPTGIVWFPLPLVLSHTLSRPLSNLIISVFLYKKKRDPSKLLTKLSTLLPSPLLWTVNDPLRENFFGLSPNFVRTSGGDEFPRLIVQAHQASRDYGTGYSDLLTTNLSTNIAPSSLEITFTIMGVWAVKPVNSPLQMIKLGICR